MTDEEFERLKERGIADLSLPYETVYFLARKVLEARRSHELRDTLVRLHKLKKGDPRRTDGEAELFAKVTVHKVVVFWRVAVKKYHSFGARGSLPGHRQFERLKKALMAEGLTSEQWQQLYRSETKLSAE